MDNKLIPWVLVITLASCVNFTPMPTPTPIPTATSFPTSTSTPTPQPTLTSTPTMTSTPTFAPTHTPVPPTEAYNVSVIIKPTGTPVVSWEGIKVMPGAIAGDGDSKSYMFIIMATTDVVEKYYEKELFKLGWNLFASGKASKGVMLMFMKDSDSLTVSIVSQLDGSTLVMLVKT